MTCILTFSKGKLTSRLWIHVEDSRIRFLRPLRNDDINTSDRKFELVRGMDDDKINLVEIELQRLRQLCTLQHPFQEPIFQVDKDPLGEIRAGLKQNRPRRKFFGI